AWRRTPWYRAGMNPAPQLRGPLTTVPLVSCMTTNAGRSWFSVPRPYVTHDPSDGRPARMDPVFIWQMPAEWLMPSPQHERITARSSAQVAVCGSQSLTHSPPLPCCCHFRLHANSGEPNSPIAVMILPTDGGSGLPAISLTLGLGSNVSMWLGPPSMNRKMHAFALAGTCGPRGPSGRAAGRGTPATAPP